MSPESRLQLSEDLMAVLSKHLAADLCTGTAKEMRERTQELALLMAQVSAVAMHNGPADGDLLMRMRRYETEGTRYAEESAKGVWSVKSPAP